MGMSSDDNSLSSRTFLGEEGSHDLSSVVATIHIHEYLEVELSICDGAETVYFGIVIYDEEDYYDAVSKLEKLSAALSFVKEELMFRWEKRNREEIERKIKILGGKED